MLTRKVFLTLIITVLSLLTACSPISAEQDKPVVVASTTLIGDVVQQISGDLVDLHVLLPVNSDPHSFSPAPKDVVMIETASLVFLNGFHLEESLENLITANAQGRIVTVSDGVQTIEIGSFTHSEDSQTGTEEQHAGPDPHVWMDPSNVQVWVENIARALSDIDPGNAAIYQQNAKVYLLELEQLNNWIADQVAQIPPERRELITDHDDLGYFAQAYGLHVVGVVVIGGSTLSDPSAQQIAGLEQVITDSGAPAIFVGTTVNSRLSERIAADTGAVLVRVYTGSLSAPDGPAGTYIEMMQYNVTAIVEALK